MNFGFIILYLEQDTQWLNQYHTYINLHYKSHSHSTFGTSNPSRHLYVQVMTVGGAGWSCVQMVIWWAHLLYKQFHTNHHQYFLKNRLVYDMSDYLESCRRPIAHRKWGMREDSQLRILHCLQTDSWHGTDVVTAWQIMVPQGSLILSTIWEPTWNSNAGYLALLFQEALS